MTGNWIESSIGGTGIQKQNCQSWLFLVNKFSPSSLENLNLKQSGR